MKSFQIFSVFALALAVAACSPSTKKSSDVDNLQEFSAKLDSIVPSLAKPSQVVAIFELSDIRYNQQLINDPLKWENYKADSMLCAANIGIYVADALYQYGTENKDGKYMKEGMYKSIAAATSLARTVGMDTEFQNLLIDRYEEGSVLADSVVGLLDNAFASSNAKAQEKSTMRFFMAMTMGNHIEKNYILLSSMLDNSENLPADVRLLLNRQVIMILKHQLEIGTQLTALAEQLQNESDPGVIVAKFKELNAVYAKMDFSFEKANSIDADKFFQNPNLLETYRLVKEMRTFLTQR